MSVEIYDLIAKISWETNQKAIDDVTTASRQQSRLLDELRTKGGRLESQMVKTNDPKKLKALNDEYQKARKSVDSITEAQKQHGKVLDELKTKHRQLLDELKKATDPKHVQGLMRGLVQVEGQMKSLTNTAKDAGSKFATIGRGLLEGFGIGIGVGAVTVVASAIKNLVSGAISEAEDAHKTAAGLTRSLKAIGQEKYFTGLIDEANQLQKQFFGLYDNDDIIKAQTALVNYGKLSRAELSKLLPVIVELASAEGIDLAQASEKIINILEGRGGQTLRDYGVTVKGVKTEHERLNVILGDFQTKLKGSSETLSNTAEGQRKILETQIADIKEQLGDKLLPIYRDFLAGVNNLLNGKAFSHLFDPITNLFVDKSEEIKRTLAKAAKDVQDVAKAGGIAKADNSLLNPNAKTAEDIQAEENAKAEREKRAKEAKEAAKKAAEDRRRTIEEADRAIKETARRNKNKIDFLGVDREEPPKEMIDEEARKAAVIQGEIDYKATEERIKNSSEILAGHQRYGQLKGEAEAKGEEEAKKKARKKQREEDKQELISEVNNLAGQIQSIYDVEISAIDRLIDAQQRRVDNARETSAESLAIEQKRLDELTAKRDKYERQQRAINAAVIVANQALAVSNSIVALSGAVKSGNALLIGANIAAVLAGLAGGYAAVRSINAGQGFMEGGYTGDGDPTDVSTNLGNRGYKYHKKEFVMNEGLTDRHRDMFEGLHKGRLMVKRMNDGGYYLTDRMLDVDKAVQNHQTVSYTTDMSSLLFEMQGIKSLLSQREVRINNNFDAEGFGMNIATQLGNIQLKNLRR